VTSANVCDDDAHKPDGAFRVGSGDSKKSKLKSHNVGDMSISKKGNVEICINKIRIANSIFGLVVLNIVS